MRAGALARRFARRAHAPARRGVRVGGADQRPGRARHRRDHAAGALVDRQNNPRGRRARPHRRPVRRRADDRRHRDGINVGDRVSVVVDDSGACAGIFIHSHRPRRDQPHAFRPGRAQRPAGVLSAHRVGHVFPVEPAAARDTRARLEAAPPAARAVRIGRGCGAVADVRVDRDKAAALSIADISVPCVFDR